jgi:hypothetical protein
MVDWGPVFLFKFVCINVWMDTEILMYNVTAIHYRPGQALRVPGG